MYICTLSKFYLVVTLLISALISVNSFAHSDDINKATLSIENHEQYRLTVTVDFVHLLKRHLEISGNDEKAINVINQMSFVEQKKLVEAVQARVSQQSSLYFDRHVQIMPTFKGLQLQHLKRILSQQANLSEYKTQLIATGKIPRDVSEVAISFSPLIGQVIVNIIRPEQEIIGTGNISSSYQIDLSRANSAKNTLKTPAAIKYTVDYIYQGFIHIIPKGLDHILFVLALLLFAKRRSTLIWQVSAFTLAHTITLALGIYGLITISSAVVEPLIALSIIYVGVENIYRSNKMTTNHARLAIIFAFGLLHGLGFASVLTEVGLPDSQYLVSLIAFNIGVELGQLTVIALAFICLLPFSVKVWYQKKLVLALNVAIAVIATYWLIERLI